MFNYIRLFMIQRELICPEYIKKQLFLIALLMLKL